MSAKRHALLIYRRQFRGWSIPALLIAIGFGVLWWFAPDLPTIPEEWRAGLDILALVGAGIGAALFAFTLIAPALAFVQCRTTYLFISTPLYRLAISYSRIRNVRPVKFVAPEAGGLKRDLVAPYLGQTAVVIDLSGYPVREGFVRFWLGWYMFQPKTTGLQFIVADWMSLSRDIDVQRSEWKMRRMERR
jgi:hypothetical protein